MPHPEVAGACRQATGEACGKLLVAGEHAVVHGHTAFALPFPAVQARATVEPRADQDWLVSSLWSGPLAEAPESLAGLAAVVKATREEMDVSGPPLTITVDSSIPAGAGLGSSAAVAAAIVRALGEAHYIPLPPARQEALVAVSERHAHGNPSGVDGRTVVREVAHEFRRAEPAGPALTPGGPFHVVVALSGQPRNTRAAVEAVSGLRERDPARAEALLDDLGRYAMAAANAWKDGHEMVLGGVLNLAQEALESLGVSTPELERLVRAARAAGALGAKLTGAGCGGCILALTPDAESARVVAAALTAAGAAQVWQHDYQPIVGAAQQDISQRKLDHIDLCLDEDVSMRANPTGFARFSFIPEALPELAPEDVDLSTTFLGRRVAAPILISSMTGGPARGEDINRHLAAAAQKLGLPMAVGSQRIIFEKPEALASFKAAREAGPEILLLGNLGAVQLNYGFDAARVIEAVRSISADGLFLHLNALQELIQPGGDTNFRGLLDRIADVVKAVPFPVLVKEVGCGIGPATALKLAERGVAAIDVSGAGGTSWAKIEAHRAKDPAQRTLGEVFGDWGLPTTVALQQCRAALPEFPLIASGGVRSGLDVAKAIAMGADMVAVAMPLLAPATRSAADVEAALRQFLAELRAAMFLTGVRDIATLRRSPHLLRETHR